MEQAETLPILEQLKLLADSRRLEILRWLMEKPATLTQLGLTLQKSPGWVRHHINTMERAGLVEGVGSRGAGRNREKYYQATSSALLLHDSLLRDATRIARANHAAEFNMRPIGVIRTPFTEKAETPIQFSRSTAFGEIEMFPEYGKGLESIDELSHLILIYVFHEALNCPDLMVKPFLDDKKHGIFATRFYQRPNPIGFSVVSLVERTGLHLKIQSVDMLDGTPLLDIKPYIPEFDTCNPDKLGWYAKRAHP